MGIVESSTQERLELREKRYQKYLELFFNTNLSTPEILQDRKGEWR